MHWIGLSEVRFLTNALLNTITKGASWTVTAVEVFNTLSNTWETCASEFTITDVTHDNAAGTSVDYKRYTCNLGYAMATRQIRIKWS